MDIVIDFDIEDANEVDEDKVEVFFLFGEENHFTIFRLKYK